MLSKNNLKYVFIVAIGFFWCSSLYLTQEQHLTNYANIDFVNIAELLFGSISMALGILVFCLMYRKNKNMKNPRANVKNIILSIINFPSI